jgi:DNA-binding NarL/FixJ family response regulator
LRSQIAILGHPTNLKIKSASKLRPSIRVLLVDDFPAFRDLLRSDLRKFPNLEIVGEASDGLEAVQKFRQLHPDLILLDLGLPKLNGIEVIRRIKTLSAKAKILVVSADRSPAIVEEAFHSGASGYLVKSDVARELRFAVESVFAGVRFFSKLASDTIPDKSDPYSSRNSVGYAEVPRNPLAVNSFSRLHRADIYSDDQSLSDQAGLFIGKALHSGNAAIVIASPSHRSQLLRNLKSYDLDLEGIFKQGRYIALDASEMLSKILLNETIDRDRFLNLFEALVEKAKIKHLRISIFGECAPILLARGLPEAAIQMEKLGSEIVSRYNVELLCGYSHSGLRDLMFGTIYQQICAEHSSLHSH